MKKKLIMEIHPKYKPILLEAIQNMMYKISLELESLKGQPMTKSRKALTKKQKSLEELQHVLYFSE